MTAPYRVTTSCGGKKPATRRSAVQADTDEEAVIAAMQWTLWSHTKGRPRALPRYTDWRVEVWDGSEYKLLREGTYEDAAKNLPEEDPTEPTDSAVQLLAILGGKARRSPHTGARQGRNRGASRLAALVARTLEDK